MKRENYLKPQTARELLAMEQGICLGSVTTAIDEPKVTVGEHYTGFDNTGSGANNNISFGEIDWN